MDEPLAALDAQRKAEVLPLERLHSAGHSGDLRQPCAGRGCALAEHMVLLEPAACVPGPHRRADGPAGPAAGPGRCSGHGGHRHRDRTCTAGPSPAWRSRGSCCWSAPSPRCDTVKLRVQARDVSLALTPPQDSSILNIVPATVAEMREDSPGQWMVALQAGPTRCWPASPNAPPTPCSCGPGCTFLPDQGHCHRELMGGSHLCAGAFRAAGQEAANAPVRGPLLWRAERLDRQQRRQYFTAP
jgi:hypothetical protein